METVGYLLALAVGAVFVAAAVPKLRRPDQTAASFDALGLPAPGALARVVPVAELATAGLLVGWPRAGGAAAVAVLVAFTAVLVRTLRAGSGVACACFGARSTEPVSGRDVVRNLLLVLAAAVATSATEPVAPDLPGAVAASMLLLIGMVVLAMADLRQRLGVVFDNTLPGEAVDQRAGLGRA